MMETEKVVTVVFGTCSCRTVCHDYFRMQLCFVCEVMNPSVIDSIITVSMTSSSSVSTNWLMYIRESASFVPRTVSKEP